MNVHETAEVFARCQVLGCFTDSVVILKVVLAIRLKKIVAYDGKPSKMLSRRTERRFSELAAV